MKNLQKLKLNQLSKDELEKRAMNYLRGGSCCTCACKYANSGGSSTSQNFGKNTQNSYYDDNYSCSCPNNTSSSDESSHMNC